MNVSQIMTRGADLVAPDTTIRDASRIMRDDDVGFLPVGENDRLVGTVTDRDITIRATAEGLAPDSTKVGDIMSKTLVYVMEHQDVGEAAALMAEHQVRRLPVLNREKRLVGIVSLGDIATGTGHLGLTGATTEAVSREAK
jgi:CBS domain-containing protein